LAAAEEAFRTKIYNDYLLRINTRITRLKKYFLRLGRVFEVKVVEEIMKSQKFG